MPTIDAIYVRLPNWVGDVCMSLPALAALGRTGVPLTVCARPWARDLLAGLPGHGFVPMTGRVARDCLAVRSSLSAVSGTAYGLLLPDSLSSAAVFRLAGLPSAGYRDDGRSFLLKWPISKPRESLHAVQSWYYLTRQALLGWELPCMPAQAGPRLHLPLTQADREAAETLLEQAGLAATPFVLIAPTATGLHRGRVKVWPHFDGLTRALQARDLVVAMCPPPAEAADAQRNAPTATRLAPQTLGIFAALARRAGLVICNDSGVSHLAAAVGARQLTLFGVTHAARSGPWSPDAACMGNDRQWPDLNAVAPRALDLLNIAQ